MLITTMFGSCEIHDEAQLMAFLAWYTMQLTAWLAEQHEVARRSA